MRRSQGQKPANRFCALGFENLGLEVPEKPLEFPEIGIVEFAQSIADSSLDTVEGLVVPQGTRQDFLPANWERQQLELQRQVTILLRRGGWLCLLIPELTDLSNEMIASLYLTTHDASLAKWIMQLTQITAMPCRGLPVVDSRDDAFRAYAERYGVAKVTFDTSKAGGNVTPVIVSGKLPVGVEAGKCVFLLPLHIAQPDNEDASALVRSTIDAILRYREKHFAATPPWLDEFQFSGEVALRKELTALTEKAELLHKSLAAYGIYKTVLTAKGDLLKDRIVQVLTEFFGLLVDPTDQGQEDFKIVDASGAVLAVAEIKGTRGGVKREYVNQVDSHRERRGLRADVPGLLIINNEIDVTGVAERFATAVASEQVKHAKRLGVLILRSIDLLYLMKHLEEHEQRGPQLLELIRRGGGWLRADVNGLAIIEE